MSNLLSINALLQVHEIFCLKKKKKSTLFIKTAINVLALNAVQLPELAKSMGTLPVHIPFKTINRKILINY